MWRNLSSKGYIESYNEDKMLRLAYRRIKSLPFLKRSDVIPAFILIRKNAPGYLSKFLDYFEQYCHLGVNQLELYLIFLLNYGTCMNM